MSDIRRFEEKFIPVTESGCWLWTASVDRGGYGQFHMSGKCAKSHRASYQLYVGPLDPSLHVCHKCDTPSCVNPEHLFLGTDADNLSDMSAKGRSPRGTRNGHTSLSEDDVRAIRSDTRAQHVIAAAYSIHQTTVSYIKRRATWAHIN